MSDPDRPEPARDDAALLDFVETAGVGLHWVGPDGTILWANEADHRLLGFAPGELVGRNIAEVFVDVDMLADMLERLRQGERITGRRAQLRTKDGSIRHFAIHSSARFSETGEFLHSRGFLWDVTEEEQARKALERTTDHLQLALAAAKMGTWEWDVGSSEVSWSPTLEAIHGLPPGGFDGSFEAYQRDIHPEDRERVLATIQGTLEGRPHDLEYRIVRPDGSLRWLEAHGHLVRDADGRPLRLAGVCMDVTARKLAEIERAQMSDELARVAEFRQRLLGIVAHDLRNPLGSITMSTELLRMCELPERGSSAVARIRRSANRMSRMISDLLDYSHGQMGGGIPITPREADMAEIGRRVVDEVRAATPEGRVAFTAEGDTRGYWDPGRVAQVIANLVGNALQHGSGEVSVTVRGEPDHVQLRVGNGGNPIPSELLPRLTQPFARSSEHGPGLGLGLYIVHEIVRAHASALRIESDAEAGTRVTIDWRRTHGGDGAARDPRPGA
jgi:PAS domain S-box-containing protein